MPDSQAPRGRSLASLLRPASAPDAQTPPADAQAAADTARAGVDAAASPQPPLEPAPALASAAAGAGTAAAAPSFLQRSRPAPRPRTPAWQWALLATLALLLVLQVLLADRARLAADAGWRPIVAALCDALGCRLPPWHEPQAFTMLGREVRPVPGVTGVLQVRASFRNDARWAQAWPQLQLSLTDADGRVIGSQAFAPAQYLGAAPPADALLAPGQSAQVTFRVREPSAGTEAFTFAFR
ncbi:DUF3426 domain-containing protein [Stenotrophomonas sp. MMGLT7]|uniref:DUF3426 domain-containing protein n=1 Tax=Stenotrophomonas sp. MMGLT7 TaxID=2901227 RepID=UPI001E320C52|nr:DUF3426 domain-containing protein [Stenotrophomonas sp. MMGLT7]MCD7097898.1 DUF3426 domain-containing protein [Stenotrophomonas sp. MMGLT7]